MMVDDDVTYRAEHVGRVHIVASENASNQKRVEGGGGPRAAGGSDSCHGERGEDERCLGCIVQLPTSEPAGG